MTKSSPQGAWGLKPKSGTKYKYSGNMEFREIFQRNSFSGIFLQFEAKDKVMIHRKLTSSYKVIMSKRSRGHSPFYSPNLRELCVWYIQIYINVFKISWFSYTSSIMESMYQRLSSSPLYLVHSFAISSCFTYTQYFLLMTTEVIWEIFFFNAHCPPLPNTKSWKLPRQ